MIVSIRDAYNACIRSLYAARDNGDFDRAAWLDWQSVRLAYLVGAT